MKATAPEMDYDFCISQGNHIAKRMNEYEKIRPTIKDKTLLENLDWEINFLKQELIFYAQLANYFRNYSN
jgi:hypothetical protein